MVEPLLRAVAPLHRPVVVAGPLVTIEEVTDFQMVSLAAGKTARRETALECFGVALPETPRRVTSGAYAFIWAGPGRWMVTSAAKGDLQRELREKLGAGWAITDQTDGRATLRIYGPKARDTLAKLLVIDLHPRAFAPGDTALSLAAHINLQIWQMDATPSYEISVFRSLADHFYHALCHAAAEFGAVV